MRMAIQTISLMACFCGLATAATNAKSCVSANQVLQSSSAESAQKFELLAGSCVTATSVSAERPKHESELLKRYDSHNPSMNIFTAGSQATSYGYDIAATPSAVKQAYASPRGMTSERWKYDATKRQLKPNMRAIALAPRIRTTADAYNIDPLFLHAIAHVESRHNPNAVSSAGARGVMQVMPATARRFGMINPSRDLFNPQLNLEVSSAYLKSLQSRFGNNLPLVLAAYNAGEGAVEKYGRRIPPYAETQGYVREVLNQYRELRTFTQQQ